MLRVVEHGHGWKVLAPWHGRERTVYGPLPGLGGLQRCVAWVARRQEA